MRCCLRLRPVRCQIAAVAVASALPGCSAHPLPQDVAQVSTVQIVRRIRCEAQEGLQEALDNAGRRGPREVRHVEKIIEGTTIGLEFQFAMSENNKAAAGELKFERDAAREGESFVILLNASANAEHSVGGDKTRENTRTFRVLDELREIKAAGCGRRARSATPNLVHPVTGSTGMAEVVRTYVDLETLTDLTASTGDTRVTFSDELLFTTTLEMGASITADLRTAVGAFRLTKASLTGTATRRDLHKVNVVLSRDPKFDADDVGGGAARSAPRIKIDRQLAKFKDVQDASLRASLTQRKALGRNRVLFELDRKRLVEEDRTRAERVLGVPFP
jgi:hypothetical protein